MKLRRLTSLLIAGCMMVSMVPASAVTAFAEDGAGTSVSDGAETTPYDKLMADIKAANAGDTVKLENDINRQVVIPESANITLDLNGHKIESGRTTLYNEGTLTLTDSVGAGKIVSTGNYAVGFGNGSTTTIDGGTFEGQEGAVGSGYTTGATVTINGGEFTGLDNAVVIFNGNKKDENKNDRVGSNQLTINDGTFNGKIQTSGYVACGIYAPWDDNITVNGGTFIIDGGAGIVARAGHVTVNGGTFKTTGDVTGKVGDSRVVVPCSALVFDSDAGYPAMTDSSKIVVNSGTFESAKGVPAITVVNEKSDTNKRIELSGGTFSTKPSDDYCVAGKTAVADNDMFTVKYKIDADVDVDEDADSSQEGTVGEPVDITVTLKATEEEMATIKTISLTFSDPDDVEKVELTKNGVTKDVTDYKPTYKIPLSLFEKNDTEKNDANDEENSAIALLSAASDAAADTDEDADVMLLSVTYKTEGEHKVTVTFADDEDIEVAGDSTTVKVGSDKIDDDSSDTSSSKNDDAGAAVAAVAIGTGVAVLTYHVGTELYAKQVLGAGVAVPKTREDVALKAWELAGKPAVAAEGETLSDTEQAERWVVESGLMKNDANGNFNGQKKMLKLVALRTLDAAKKLG